MIRNTVKERLLGQMEEVIEVNGGMVYNMEKVIIKIKTGRKSWEFGKMDLNAGKVINIIL